MTEIQRLLTETIEVSDTCEKRDKERPLVSVLSVNIRGCLSVCTLLFFATLAVMLQSETLLRSVLATGCIGYLLNGFFFANGYPRYRYDILRSDLRVCYNGEWYNTALCTCCAGQAILNSPRVGGCS
ncbi:YlaC family protein [Escherichia coli]